MYHSDRGAAAGGTQHGPSGLCAGGGPEKVHQRQGVH